jgi:hypothetical protein
VVIVVSILPDFLKSLCAFYRIQGSEELASPQRDCMTIQHRFDRHQRRVTLTGDQDDRL